MTGRFLRACASASTLAPLTTPPPPHPPAYDPAAQIDLGLRYGPYGRPEQGSLSLGKLRQHPQGVDLGPLQPRLPAAAHPAGYPLLLADLARACQVLAAGPGTASDQLLLIGRRELRSNNSWMHYLPRLLKGRNRCPSQLSLPDAAARPLAEGQLVRVRSRVGEVQVPVKISPDLMPGVASLPHGYGHQRPGTRLAVARAHPGVSLNDLTDETRLDALTGNAALSAVPV